MRAFVYLLSLLIVIAPIHSYAVLPIVPAIVGHATGEVAVGTTKAVIKKVSPEAKKNLTKGALAICSKNTAVATFCGAVMSTVASNDWTIENNNTTNNNDIDINVYQKNQDICSKTTIFYDRFDQNYRHENAHRYKTDKSEVFFEYFNQNYKTDRNVTYSYSNLKFEPSDTTIFELLKKNSYTQVKSHFTMTTKSYTGKVDVNDKAQLIFYAFKLDEKHACFSKSRVSDDDLVNIFNSLSDDDVANIYNYDYSQHNVITVNNNTTAGDVINNSKNNFDKNYNEKKLSENATNKMKSGDKDYTIDKINDKNCSKNDKGEYDKCGKDKDKTDEDTKCKKNEVLVNGECKEKKGDEQDNHDEQIILFCKENPELCEKIFEIEDNTDDLEEKSDSILDKLKEIFDWVDDEAEVQTDTEVDIEEPETEKISGDRVDFKAECPDGIGFTYTMFGNTYSAEIDVRPLCEFAKGIKPYMVGSALLSSVYIIVGVRRD